MLARLQRQRLFLKIGAATLINEHNLFSMRTMNNIYWTSVLITRSYEASGAAAQCRSAQFTSVTAADLGLED
jgi:hypothetical protein